MRRRLHFHAKEFLEDTLRYFGRICTYIVCKLLSDGSMHVYDKYFRHSYLPTRNPADARKHETNLPLTNAASAESDDVTRNSYSGFVVLRKVPNSSCPNDGWWQCTVASLKMVNVFGTLSVPCLQFTHVS
jgi:hypothetical protein